MSDKSINVVQLEKPISQSGSLYHLDSGWLIELVGAAISWLLNEPIIAIIALMGKGVLQHYQTYLSQLTAHHYAQHSTLRIMMGCGLLMALPMVMNGTPLYGVIALLLGVLISWLILLATGCTSTASWQALPTLD